MGLRGRARPPQATRDFRILKPSVEGALAKRFFAEGSALAIARHPNLPDVYDSGSTPSGLSYMALEVARDPTLRQLLRQAQGPLPVSRAATVGAGILAGLVAAHRAGVVHGDVRPENVLVAPGDQARLAGFAFARFTAPSSPTQTLAYVGLRSYASPEQAAGATQAAAADQYSCGVILYEMLAGMHPFGPAAGANPPRPLSEVAPGVPAALAGAVMKALAKRAELRHRDADELQRIVARFATV